ncbi:hypothetical protein [Streptomyces sp. NPDC001843]
MYAQEQAEEMAADYLRRVSADWGHEVALFVQDLQSAGDPFNWWH